MSEWDKNQIRAWRNNLQSVRSYEQVQDRILSRQHSLSVVEYGRLPQNPDRFPLYYLAPERHNPTKRNILISAGVHGYESSGIWAALKWAEVNAQRVSEKFNVYVFPCICPWSFENDERWNFDAEDPNRAFRRDNPRKAVHESLAFMDAIERLGITFELALDLHETPDRDRQLRHLWADRFGTSLPDDWQHIPDGFYLIADPDYQKTQGYDFCRAIVNEVARKAKIAQDPKIFGAPNIDGVVFLEFSGILTYYLKSNQLARYCAVSEVHPDPLTFEETIDVQMSVINGGVSFLIANNLEEFRANP